MTVLKSLHLCRVGDVLLNFLNNSDCGVVSLFIFLEKTKQKIVVALESLRFQGRLPQQARIRVIDGELS